MLSNKYRFGKVCLLFVFHEYLINFKPGKRHLMLQRLEDNFLFNGQWPKSNNSGHKNRTKISRNTLKNKFQGKKGMAKVQKHVSSLQRFTIFGTILVFQKGKSQL